jgi:aspartyl-tRNA(Asn)/glutamyl-tRNA(Gln) amidotransferase subunit A
MPRLTQPFNLTAHALILASCGLTTSGVPIGLQMVGETFEQAMVLQVIRADAQAMPWHSYQ